MEDNLNCKTSNEIAEFYISKIDIAKQNKASNLPNLYFDCAHFLFDLREYELALNMFQSAYSLNFKKSEIEQFIYDTFIIPNISEFQDTYMNNIVDYQNQIIVPNIPSFSELFLHFIPVMNEKYYIFNNKEKLFVGIIDLNLQQMIPDDEVTNQDSFYDIVVAETWDLSKLVDFLLSHSNKNIYFVSSCIELTLSFLSVPHIVELLCVNVTFFDNMASLQKYFHENTGIYLPKQYLGSSDSLEYKLFNQILEEEHAYRLTPEGRNRDNILLTIAIPSFNRGHRALTNINHLLLSEYDAEIEFLVRNNCSTENTEGYEVISNMNDSRVYYNAADYNCGTMNFGHVIDLAHGKYTCLLSDEDLLIHANLGKYLNILHENPSLTFVNSNGIYMNNAVKIQNFSRGTKAFLDIFMTLQYVSGLIYKTELYHSLNIGSWLKEYIPKNIAVSFYPHSCFALFFVLHGDYCNCVTPLYNLGESEPSKNINIDKPELLSYHTLESRMEQFDDFIIILNLFYDAIEPEASSKAFVTLCYKTFYLLSIVKDRFLTMSFDWNKIIKTAYTHTVLGIDKLAIKPSTKEYTLIKQEINENFTYVFGLSPNNL